MRFFHWFAKYNARRIYPLYGIAPNNRKIWYWYEQAADLETQPSKCSHGSNSELRNLKPKSKTTVKNPKRIVKVRNCKTLKGSE